MAISNAGELVSAVTNWLARAPDAEDSVVQQIPNFILLAETRFFKKLRVPENMFRSQAYINEPRERLPANFHDMVSLAYMGPPSNAASKGTTHVLRYVSPNQFYSFDNQNGDPYYYTIVGPELSFGPFLEWDASTPESELGYIELVYYASLPGLDTSDSNSTNDILFCYPDIYLFGTLVESQAYIASAPELFNRWVQMYERAIDDANDVTWDATQGPAVQYRDVAVV